MMIEINLVPESLRVQKVKETSGQQIPWNLILLAANGVLLTVLLLVTAVNVSRVISLRALNTRLNGLAPEQQKIIKIQKRISELKQVNATFAEFVSQNSLWSKTLNKFSDMLMPGIWFRQLVCEKKALPPQKGAMPNLFERLVTVNGTVVAVKQDEVAVINEFIRNVKNDQYCRDVFQDIKLESVLRRKIGPVEVMDFILICRFK